MDTKTGELVTPLQEGNGHIIGYVIGEQVMWKKTDTYDAYGPIQAEEQSIEEITVEVGIGATVGLTHDWREKRLDPTGYIWMGSRYYEPGSGRFISPDPYGHEGSIDLYSYANGNPVYYCDADGRFASAVYEQAKEDPIGAMQYGLDAAGMIPLFGIAPDLVNALVHSVRGNNVDAMLSLAAAIPIVGDVGRGVNIVSDIGRMAAKVESKTPKLLTTNYPQVPTETGGIIRSYVLPADTKFYRVYNENPTGKFLTSVPPKSRIYDQEALALPPWNDAKYLQEVIVPKGTRIQRSRAASAFGRRGGGEQFELLDKIPSSSFKPGKEFHEIQ